MIYAQSHETSVRPQLRKPEIPQADSDVREVHVWIGLAPYRGFKGYLAIE